MIDFLGGRQLELVFALLAICAALLAWVSLKRMHADRSSFDMRDLLMENGRVSKLSCVMMGAFAATTWQFVFFSLNGKMTEGYAGIYVAAWIAPVVARLISRNDSAPVTVTTETTTTLTAPKGKK